MVATRVPEDTYRWILSKCAEIGCSTYDYLATLIETEYRQDREVARKPEVKPDEPVERRIKITRA